ncbi:hypothetical protein SE17_21650 [Kouleothrix aurantiaca]|uniref:CYTH domain-containing protein n=1 Tax=Kouleothrix aurantiaca TaxID=186479 RepID=A0A0P9FEF6_9CHLR|nr:hypothetical protein SE17_21650 [Kouleothrix aurantiaca]
MEIEAKFRVERSTTFTELQHLAQLGLFTLVATPGIEYQQNTYFDTAERKLNSQRYSLRVRETGKRRIATVKRSLGAQNGLRRHEEWEVLLTGGDHPREWPNSPARDQALGLLGEAPLLSLITILTQRQFIYAVRDAAVIAEISLDQGVIKAGGRELDFRELEVELVAPGGDERMNELIAELQARLALAHEPLGKKKRGMALLDGLIGLPPARLETVVSAAPAKSAAALALGMR